MKRNISRKSFVTRLGAAAAAGLATPSVFGGHKALPAFESTTPEAFWRAVQSGYALTDRRIYLNTAGLGPVPTSVLEETARIRLELQGDAETGRHEDFDPAREVVAAFLGAEPYEIAFTRNATEGNSIIAAGLELRRGDEVIFESHAHPGGSFPWLNQQKLHGVRVRVFEPSAVSAEENLERIHALITPRTRVIQLSHITAPTGILFPVARVVKLARDAGVWLHIDAAQSVGMIPVDVRALDCDSLAVSGHKWIGGPHETGALFIRRERLPEVTLAHAGAYSDGGYELPDHFAYGETAHRFEYGTRDAGAAAGLAAACRLQEKIGRDRIAAHGLALARHAADALAEIDGVEVLTPTSPGMHAAIATFRIQHMDCRDAFSRLLSEHKLRCRPVTEQNLDAVRIAPHVFNSVEQIDTLVDAVRVVAAA